MVTDNLVLQICDENGCSLEPCISFGLTGLPRPCRVLFLAADVNAEAQARMAHRELALLLSRATGHSPFGCGGPGLWSCRTWGQPGCAQLLVPVISQQIGPSACQIMLRWMAQSGARGTILPALAPGLRHGYAFAGCPTSLRRLNIANWLGDPARLAAVILQHATSNPHPGVFLSYRRSEAGKVADQIFDGLSQRGWKVFLDRYCGTGGRYFPNELAEEMADKAALVVLETPGIASSTWTMWEIAFAHRYRLGLVALSLPNAPSLARIAKRHHISPDATGQVPPADLPGVIDFIEREVALAALRRRAFYEAIVESAAHHGSGTVQDRGNGTLNLIDRHSKDVAAILPSGRPGTLAEVRQISGATQSVRILAGQHEHLPQSALEDLRWLAAPGSVAGVNGVELRGRFDTYQRVRSLC